MKIPEGTKSILCVCTGGKDRSPIMAEYFRSLGYEARAVGISEYRTEENGTAWLRVADIEFADMIVVVSSLHEAFVRGVERGAGPHRYHLCIRTVEKLGTKENRDGMSAKAFRDWVLSIMREAFPVSGGR